MASRPIFFPLLAGAPGVRMELVRFPWSPGMAPSQKRKNVEALHQAVVQTSPGEVPLEASSKSPDRIGTALSAFSLRIASERSGGPVCVESLYQCSKVFADAGPFPQGYALPATEARALLAPHAAKPLIGFNLHGVSWPLTPARAFYDWVYCQVLHRNRQLVAALAPYTCFTDIEFNPARSVNCQAYAIAFYRSLVACGKVKEALSGQAAFLRIHPRGTGFEVSASGAPLDPRRAPRQRSARKRRIPAVPPAVPLTLFDEALPSNE